MADKKKNKPVRGGKMRTIRNICFMIFLAFVLRYAVMVFLLGMLPYFVANYVDQSRDKNAAKVIFAMNFAGVLPYLAKIWVSGISSDSVHGLLATPHVWMVMWGSAGLGWILVHFLPKMTRFTLDAMGDNQVSNLQSKQQAIVNEWGMQTEAVSLRALRNVSNYQPKKKKKSADTVEDGED